MSGSRRLHIGHNCGTVRFAPGWPIYAQFATWHVVSAAPNLAHVLQEAEGIPAIVGLGSWLGGPDWICRKCADRLQRWPARHSWCGL
jgi:hypothetical protein